MFQEFITLYYESVISTYSEYCIQRMDDGYGRSKDLKLGLASAQGLFHIREHLPDGCQMSRTEVERLCPEYKIIADVVNASKHRELTHNSPSLSNARQIYELMVVTMYADEEGHYSYSEKVVRISLDKGDQLNLHDVLYIVISFWEQYLYSKGVLESERGFEIPTDPDSPGFKTRSECRNVTIKAVQKMPLQIQVKFQEYDMDTGDYSPIQMTDPMFRVYKQQVFDVVVKNKAGKEVVKFPTELSHEEMGVFHDLEEGQREDYVLGLASVKSKVQEFNKTIENAKAISGYKTKLRRPNFCPMCSNSDINMISPPEGMVMRLESDGRLDLDGLALVDPINDWRCAECGNEWYDPTDVERRKFDNLINIYKLSNPKR